MAETNKISELRANQGNVNVEGNVIEKGELRSFTKFGKELKLANAILEDDSGKIKLTLWNDDAVRIKEGDMVKISNGYVSEFQGEKQLTSGKFGKIEKFGEKPIGVESKKTNPEDEYSEEDLSEEENTSEKEEEYF